MLALLSTFIVAPAHIKTGTNVVTKTYEFAADAIGNQSNPYGSTGPERDIYKYGPVFAILYLPLGKLDPVSQAIAWAFFVSSVFWFGFLKLASAFGLFMPKTKSFWIFLALASLELDGSLRYQQVNGLLIGLAMVGWALVVKRKEFRALLALVFASFLKALPLPFVGVLLLESRKRVFSVSILSLFFFLIPVWFLGWQQNLQWHLSWWETLRADSLAPGLLDVKTVFGRMGFLRVGIGVSIFVGTVTGVVFIERVFRGRLRDTAALFFLGVLTILLLNPRTESPTFVWASPAMFFLGIQCKHILNKVCFAAAVFLMSICFSDIWPKSLWNPLELDYAPKIWGALLLWLLALWQVYSTQARIQRHGRI